MLAEQADGTPRYGGIGAKRLQRFFGQHQAGMKGFAHDQGDAALHEKMGVATIADADDEAQVGKMAMGHVHHIQCLVHVAEGHNHHLSRFGTGGA